MGIVVILIAGRENGDIPIQDGVVLGRLEVMDGIDLRRASRLFIGIVRRKGRGITEGAGNDGSSKASQRATGQLRPQGQAGALTPDERQRIISTSMVYGKYDRLNDRVSAYEILSERMEQAMQEKEQALQQKEEEKRLKEEAKQQREEERLQAAEERKRKAEERERQRAKEKSLGGSLQKMVVTKAKRELVNEAFKLGRGLLGSLLKGRK